jgi:serine/threonine-protein kinase PknG
MTQRCNHPGCGLVVDPDGLCGAFHEQDQIVIIVEPIEHYLDLPVVPGDREVAGPPPRAHRRSRIGAGVVYVPPAPFVDPHSVVQIDPPLPEQIICTNCSRTVRAGDGNPALGADSGECPCGARYDFAPKLQPGDLVENGHYRVLGVLDRGGQSWIHLAEDLKLDHMPCVLKARRHTEDSVGDEVERRELKALASLSHPGIVKIFNVVEHADATGRQHRYPVMEYVPGRSLEHHRRLDPAGTLPAAHALAFVHAVMPALGHLHDAGLAYCDLKPANILHADDAVTLIDLGGAAQRIETETRITVFTRGFRAPELLETPQPTVASDICSAGRTLAVLICGSWPRWAEDQSDSEFGPPPRDHPALLGHDALWRLLRRACADAPEDRFVDAEELAEALLGVMHQVTAQVEARPKPYDSRRWGPPRHQLARLDWRSLPEPILPEQPARADQFSTAGGADPRAIIRMAGGSVSGLSWSSQAALVRALCEVGDFPAAREAAHRIDAYDDGTAERMEPSRETAIVEAARHYLIGVVELAADDRTAASDRFERAYDMAPGEPACALALAVSLEGDDGSARSEEAERLYAQVADTDPSWVAAAAGRARCLQQLGRWEDAARSLMAVPEVHPLRYDALTMACRQIPDGCFDQEVASAAQAVLPRDPESWYAREAELAAALFQMSLAARRRGDQGAADMVASPGELAADVSMALRRQAAFVPTAAARHRLLDEAAQVRPWRWWR